MSEPYTIEDDIKGALVAIHPHDGFKKHGGIYAFTNEYLNNYVPLFDLAGKDVLTVTSSGDHALNIALENPKSITCFDINRIAKYWSEFKMAGVLALSPKEFKQLFLNDFVKKYNDRAYSKQLFELRNTLFSDEKMYQRIRQSLDKDTAHFWDVISESDLTRYDLFREVSMSEFWKNFNSYFDDAKYKKLQKTLPGIGIKYIDSDLLELPGRVDGARYDTVFTSNIYDYVPDIKYRVFIEKQLGKMLKPCGHAQVYHASGFGFEWENFRFKGFDSNIVKSEKSTLHVLQSN